MGYDNERLMEDLPWARRFAKACTAKLPSHLDHDDLQSAGVLGYLRAAARYDVSRGTSFRSYCAVRIRGAVLDELRRWDWAPRSVHRQYRRISRVTSVLAEQLEREPTGAELAEALGIESSELASYRTLAKPRQLVSFDEMIDNPQGEESLPLTERLPDSDAAHPDAALLSAEDRRLVQESLASLPEVQARVIVMHYYRNVPLRDIAESLKVTPSRTSQLHHEALGRLKRACRRSQALAGSGAISCSRSGARWR
jgi:RNA polymerase sigma factor for flagellar operon FliA